MCQWLWLLVRLRLAIAGRCLTWTVDWLVVALLLRWRCGERLLLAIVAGVAAGLWWHLLRRKGLCGVSLRSGVLSALGCWYIGRRCWVWRYLVRWRVLW